MSSAYMSEMCVSINLRLTGLKMHYGCHQPRIKMGPSCTDRDNRQDIREYNHLRKPNFDKILTTYFWTSQSNYTNINICVLCTYVYTYKYTSHAHIYYINKNLY